MDKNSDFYRKKAKTHLEESIKVQKETLEKCIDSILAGAELIASTFSSGNKVLICGNGGSAADSQHMTTEFVSAFDKKVSRPSLPAIALTTDSSIITAYSNDFSFDGVFERQVEGLGKSNDLLVGISTSGNSKNVIKAFEVAKKLKLRTLALTGESGKLKEMADVAVAVPSKNTQYIQESLLAIEHTLCELVEDYLFVENKK